MTLELWFVVAGVLLLFMAMAGSTIRRLPLSTAMLYLFVGIAFGPPLLSWIRFHPLEHTKLLEHASEAVVIVALFTAGLKMRVPLTDRKWILPVWLAFVSMTLTVGMMTFAGMIGLGLPLGAAVLLGAILAPTDPVLASDVQLQDPADRDRMRFTLTTEAGLNDGTAFPFVMLGLGLLGLHEIGAGGWRWLVIDVLWAIPGGLLIGALLGVAVGRFVLYLRKTHLEAVGLDDFLALGLLLLTYGIAVLAHTYGFLAVFAAGTALRQVELRATGAKDDAPPIEHTDDPEQVATDPQHAPAYMAHAVLSFNEQLERIGELALVIVIGSMLLTSVGVIEHWWIVPLLLLVIRPIAVLLRPGVTRMPVCVNSLMSWFGIRGIGSLYYLTYAISTGVDEKIAVTLISITLTTIGVSIVVHGISVTPLMNLYTRLMGKPSPSEPAMDDADAGTRVAG